MFNKKKKQIALQMCYDSLIRWVVYFEHNMQAIDDLINELKHDKDAIKFDRLLRLMESSEHNVELYFGKDNEYGESGKKYADKVKRYLTEYKKQINLILYGANFGDKKKNDEKPKGEFEKKIEQIDKMLNEMNSDKEEE